MFTDPDGREILRFRVADLLDRALDRVTVGDRCRSPHLVEDANWGTADHARSRSESRSQGIALRSVKTRSPTRAMLDAVQMSTAAHT